MSGKRWGIGLVTLMVALGTAFVTFCLALFIAIGLCDYNYSDVELGSTTADFCSSGNNSIFYLAYLVLPLLSVVTGGVVGIRRQRWDLFWLGVGSAVIVMIGGPVAIAALPNS